jgi:hypothetical protein
MIRVKGREIQTSYCSKRFTFSNAYSVQDFKSQKTIVVQIIHIFHDISYYNMYYGGQKILVVTFLTFK